MNENVQEQQKLDLPSYAYSYVSPGESTDIMYSASGITIWFVNQ
jgi:hypothetical protein